MAIPPDSVDQNGHVSNIAYVQWMQEAAMRHFENMGGVPAMRAAGGTWVVHSHKIQYFYAAFSGERLEIRTWVASIRRVRSSRVYEFLRTSDNRLIVKGETDWVFVDVKSGRPMTIPQDIVRTFRVRLDENSEI
jgi:acyl-CoA thioester hydrolase